MLSFSVLASRRGLEPLTPGLGNLGKPLRCAIKYQIISKAWYIQSKGGVLMEPDIDRTKPTPRSGPHLVNDTFGNHNRNALVDPTGPAEASSSHLANRPSRRSRLGRDNAIELLRAGGVIPVASSPRICSPAPWEAGAGQARLAQLSRERHDHASPHKWGEGRGRPESAEDWLKEQARPLVAAHIRWRRHEIAWELRSDDAGRAGETMPPQASRASLPPVLCSQPPRKEERAADGARARLQAASRAGGELTAT